MTDPMSHSWISIRVGALLAALLLVASAGALRGQAFISSFSPEYGSPGDQILISGSGFTSGTIHVYFWNNVLASATATSDSIIYAFVPNAASTGPISVQVNSGTPTSSSQNFTVIGAGPYVSGFSPNAGGNQLVSIDGAHFTGVTSVTFAGTAGKNLNVQSDIRIQVTAPATVTSGPLVVNSPNGSFTSSNYYGSPVLTGFTPAAGRSGTNLVLTGGNLLGTGAVLFAGTNGGFSISVAPLVLSNGALQVTVPAGAATGMLRITAPGGSFTTSSNFIVRPTIFGFSPGFGPAGTSVTITGANLNASTPTVRFNGVSSSMVNGISFGQVTAVVPATTTGPVSVTTSDGSYTNASNFYLPASITSFTPTNSAPGTTVTITGQNLLGTTNVTFNGAAASFTAPTNNTTLRAVVPADVQTGPIQVTTPAGTATSSGRFYGAPSITGFNPTHGLPGTNVTITGLNLLGATAVKFNGLTATFVPPTNNTSLQAVVPPNAQTGPITVVAPAGTNTSSSSFVLDYFSDLGLSLTDAPDPLFVGSNLVYTLVITNSGPLPAPNVGLTNTLPGTVTLVASSTSQGTLSGVNPIIGNFGNLPVGSSINVLLTVRVQNPGTITDMAGVASGYTDPVPANNAGSITTTVLPLPFLSVQLAGAQRVQLSWPVVLTNFALQSRPDLKVSSLWSNVPTAPTIVGDQNVVIETNTAASRLYRLKK